MTPGNQEGRRRAPEVLRRLTEIASRIFFGYRRDYYTASTLVDNAVYHQYPEAFQPTPAQQPEFRQTSVQEMAPRAIRETTNTLINTVGQGAAQSVMQSPGTWARREADNPNAPQGPFAKAFIQQETAQAAPGFADLFGRQAIQMSEADIRSEVDEGMDQVDAFLRQQANDSQLEDA